METILGFLAGYWVGSQDGRGGAARVRESIDAIRRPPEARRLAGQALGFAELAVRRAASGRGPGLSGSVAAASELIDRAAAIARGDGPRRAA